MGMWVFFLPLELSPDRVVVVLRAPWMSVEPKGRYSSRFWNIIWRTMESLLIKALISGHSSSISSRSRKKAYLIHRGKTLLLMLGPMAQYWAVHMLCWSHGSIFASLWTLKISIFLSFVECAPNLRPSRPWHTCIVGCSLSLWHRANHPDTHTPLIHHHKIVLLTRINTKAP